MVKNGDIELVEVKEESVDKTIAIESGVPEYVKCTACNKLLHIKRRRLCQHPKLSCIICKTCLKYINSQKYERDEIGIEELCTWCGDGGNLICCDFCEKAFCRNCIKRNLGKPFLQALVNAPENVKWKCFYCDRSQIQKFLDECETVIKYIQKENLNDSINIANGLSNHERLNRIVEVENQLKHQQNTEPVRYKSSFPKYEDENVESVSSNEGYIQTETQNNVQQNIVTNDTTINKPSTPNSLNSVNKNQNITSKTIFSSQRSRRSSKPVSYNEDKLQKQAEEKAAYIREKDKKNKKRPLVTLEISDSSDENSDDEVIIVKKNGKKKRLSKSLVLAAHAALLKKQDKKLNKSKKGKSSLGNFMRLSLNKTSNKDSDSDTSSSKSSDNSDHEQENCDTDTEINEPSKQPSSDQKDENSTPSAKDTSLVNDEQKPGPSGIQRKTKPAKRRSIRKRNSDSSDLSDNDKNNSRLIQYTPMRNTLTAEDDPFSTNFYSPREVVATSKQPSQQHQQGMQTPSTSPKHDHFNETESTVNCNNVSHGEHNNEEHTSEKEEQNKKNENTNSSEKENNSNTSENDSRPVTPTNIPNVNGPVTPTDIPNVNGPVTPTDIPNVNGPVTPTYIQSDNEAIVVNNESQKDIDNKETTKDFANDESAPVHLQPVVVLSDMKKTSDSKRLFENEHLSNSSDSDDEVPVSKRTSKRKTRFSKSKQSSDSEIEFTQEPNKKRNSKRLAKKKKKSETVGSDSEESLSNESDGNNSSDSIHSNHMIESSSESDQPIIITRKKKRKRRKTKKKGEEVEISSDDNDDGDEDQDKLTPSKRSRRKIRRILKDSELTEETLHARELEEQRRKRLLERTLKENEAVTKVLDVVEGEYVLEKDDNKQPLVCISKDINKHLKPHQRKGIQFMYDCLIETVKSYKKGEEGSGCLLAHCMGLGKTLQIISFVHTLTYNENLKVKTFLVVAPYNTVLNWEQEFDKWIKYEERISLYIMPHCRDIKDRVRTLKDWYKHGGVCVMGYEMYRNLVNYNHIKSKKQKEDIKECLVDPGPNIVVCDEGHVLRNSNSAISIAMNGIRTKRRVALTGTPLQNNLPEYFVMVDFIKPKLLGTRKEFQNRFVNPIHNGQCSNSTPRDVKVMKQRCHVLFQLLSGCVQRQDYSVLTPFLPQKREYTIFVRLTEKQRKMYQYYLENFVYVSGEKLKGSSLFSDFHCLQRISAHPWALHMERMKSIMRNRYKEDSMDEFLDDEESAEETPESADDSKPKPWIVESSSDEETDKKRRKRRRYVVSGSDDSESSDTEIKPEKPKTETNIPFSRKTRSAAAAEIGVSRDEVEKDDVLNADGANNVKEKEYEEEWYDAFLKEEDEQNVELSGKLVLLLEILANAEVVGDKVIVFSQSLVSLDLIEAALGGGNIGGNTLRWCHGVDYFRMDGSTSVQKRQRWSEIFNDPENPACRLFLISTKAGSLGINMVSANRVVVFDCSWNPSHDVQSVFRVYRFGQEKPCYVYRLIAQGTMEEKVYDRQITKLAVAGRVVDEQQIERHFTDEEIRELYTFAPEDIKDSQTPSLPKDPLLAEVLQRKHPTHVVRYHEHDLLLENVISEELTEEERQQAWKSYEDEKDMAARRITYLSQPLPTTQQNNVQQFNDRYFQMMENQRLQIVQQLNQANRAPDEPIRMKVTIPAWLPKERHPQFIEEKRKEINMILLQQRYRQQQQTESRGVQRYDSLVNNANQTRAPNQQNAIRVPNYSQIYNQQNIHQPRARTFAANDLARHYRYPSSHQHSSM